MSLVGNSCACLLRNCESLVDISELYNIDFSNVTNVEQMFQFCSSLTYVQNLNTSNVINFQYMFSNCTNIVTIMGINLTSAVSDLSSTSYSSPLYRIFYSCYLLENITFYGSINASLDLSNSDNLTHDSIMSAINALGETTTTKTLTLGTTNLSKLTDVEKTIATAKGWTLI